MKVVYSLKSLLTTGRPWLAIAELPLEIYTCIEDEMGDPDYDSYPLREEVAEWLGNLPRGSWSETYQETGPGHGVGQSPYVCWNRPVRFRRKKQAVLFMLAWSRR